MVTAASVAALEINAVTEEPPTTGKEGVKSMTTESTAEQTLKATDVLYFWIEGRGGTEDRTYHYCRDCAWLAVALWRGGRLVTSDAPPQGAADTAWVWGILTDLQLQPEWQPGRRGDPESSGCRKT